MSKKIQNSKSSSDRCLDTAVIGRNQQLICVPDNSTFQVPGLFNKLKEQKESVLVRQVRHHNLPNEISINSCYAKPINRPIPIVIIDTSSENTWIKQPQLAAEIFEVNFKPWQYNTLMDQEDNTIKMTLKLTPSAVIKAELNEMRFSMDDQQDQLPEETKDLTLNFIQSQTSTRI